MDAEHFAALLRFYASAPSRRGLLVGLSAGLFDRLLLACGGEEAAAKKRKRRRKKKKKKRCTPEPPDATCAGRCGNVSNNSQQLVGCTCPTDQECLSDGSCAASCNDALDCLFFCPCSSPNTEGQRRCVQAVDRAPPCRSHARVRPSARLTSSVLRSAAVRAAPSSTAVGRSADAPRRRDGPLGTQGGGHAHVGALLKRGYGHRTLRYAAPLPSQRRIPPWPARWIGQRTADSPSSCVGVRPRIGFLKNAPPAARLCGRCLAG